MTDHAEHTIAIQQATRKLHDSLEQRRWLDAANRAAEIIEHALKIEKFCMDKMSPDMLETLTEPPAKHLR